MSFVDFLVILGTGLWSLFLIWISIFIAPFRNPEVLWILIPIYLFWIFTEIYQEKRKTSFGNAISNGAVVLWVGIDWTRYLIRQLGTDMSLGFDFYSKIALSIFVFVYGVVIILYGIKVKRFIPRIGRIREITYVLIMFTPIIYGVVKLNFQTISAIVLFFLPFYFIIEFINRKVPDPSTYEGSSL